MGREWEINNILYNTWVDSSPVVYDFYERQVTPKDYGQYLQRKRKRKKN